ncbi:hypothetical protein BBJ29_004112 [Phytophthora kernoviae]|uniref:Elicitin n=1 Tax=Phytophthora kernoviae TaxID=325452 RepID=A0A3F2RQ72_9STRA|nr:hypothetical protein BBJ29_004112 [Phytophthora kernoviae]RLN61226.1 hypothetical protein BBP00_00005521 [Phytophthora kernoviae]
MKFFTATIAAVVSTVTAASSSGSYADCSTSVLSALLTDQYIDQCASDSGYVFTAASIPTQDVIDLIQLPSVVLGLDNEQHVDSHHGSEHVLEFGYGYGNPVHYDCNTIDYHLHDDDDYLHCDGMLKA